MVYLESFMLRSGRKRSHNKGMKLDGLYLAVFHDFVRNPLRLEGMTIGSDIHGLDTERP
jgi:hypothetical protein